MIRTKIVAVPKGSATSGLNPYKSNNGSSSISPSTGTSGGSSSGGDSTKDCLWQTGDGDSSIISKGSDDLTSNMLEVAIGQYNKTTKDKTSFSVGNGTSTADRSNAFEVQADGTAIAYTFQSGTVNTTTINSATINNSANIVNGGNFSNGGDITNTGNFTNGGNITNDGNITNTGTLKTSYATVDNDLTVGKTITTKTINADVGNIKDIYSDNITNKKMIKTKDLTVTGTAHFFELVIDKIKAAGGAAIFTPADGFDIDVVEAVENGYKLYWRCEVDGKVRQNMWKVNDQAICMSFNQAKVGVSYNVSNKYYWSLVTAVSDYGKPVTLSDGNKYNWITISTVTFDGTVNPEKGDSIAMLGYRGTDDEKRQSAIYISAYASFDKGVDAPFIAQYKGIKDFDIEKYRTSWWSLKTNKFVGDFVIESSGKNVVDFINEQIKVVDGKVDSSVTELNTSINEKYSSLSATIDGINTKVVNNTTSITKLSENLNDTNKNLEETNKNLDTTNGNITKLENTVKENYSTLDQKADSIDAKVVANTTKITKLGTNLETTNSNITSLETSVNEKFASIDINAGGILSKVEENTKKIKTLGTNLETTNSNITALETTVSENYSTLDQKADGISTKVASNTTKITTLGENLDTTNANVTSLKKTVTENYSTLDQKADSISSTVSSHTTEIEGLDGRVTTNTENISNIKQTADSITSTVTALDQTVNANTGEITTLKKSMSEIGQSADNIYMKIVNDLQETGIDIKSGQINLQATNTNIIGNMNVYKSDTGVVIYDDENQERVSIANKKIGKFNDVNAGAAMLRTATGQKAFDNTSVCNNRFTANWYCTKKSVQSPIIDLGHFSVGDYISSYQDPNNSPKIYCTTSFLGSRDDIDDLNKNMPKCIAIDNARISIMKNGVEIKTYNIGNVSGNQNYVVDRYTVGYTLTNGILSQQYDHRLTWNLSKVDGNGRNIVEQNLYLITLTWKFIYYTDINHTNVEWYHRVTEAGNYSLCIKGDLVFGPVEYLRDDATHGWGKKGNYSIGNNWYFSNEQTYMLNKSNQQRTVIGTDGIASIIGTNKLLYIGQDGIIAKWKNSVIKLDDDGISEVKYYTRVDGSQLEMAKRLGGAYCVEVNGNSSTTASNPYVFGVLDGIDVVVTTGENVLVGLPRNAQDGRVITVIPKAKRTWVNFNGVNYMRHDSNTREVNNSIYLNQYVARKYVYEKMSNVWFEI